LSNVEVGPNPFNPYKDEKLRIYYTPTSWDKKIYVYNIIGDLVKEIESDNIFIDYAIWNGKNEKGNIVSPGLYIVNIVFTNNLGQKHSVIKRVGVVK
jgi:flagellar hook assembly protein FlgD